MDFGARAVAETSLGRLADGLGPLSGICAKAACEGALRAVKPSPSPVQAPAHPAQPDPCVIHSLFESEFSPKKNASIARFWGLCRYQIGSGISVGFRGAGGCGNQSLMACGRVGAAAWNLCKGCLRGALRGQAQPNPKPSSSSSSSSSPSQTLASPTLFLRANSAP